MKPDHGPRRAQRSGGASASPLLHDTSFFSIPMAGRGPPPSGKTKRRHPYSRLRAARSCLLHVLYTQYRRKRTAGPPHEIGGMRPPPARLFWELLRADRAVPEGRRGGGCVMPHRAAGSRLLISYVPRGGTGPHRANPLLRGRSAQSSPAARRFSSAGPGPGRTARRAAVKKRFFPACPPFQKAVPAV